MVSFIQSTAAVTAALLASAATTEAAYGRVYLGSPRPSTALGSRMLPSLAGSPIFARDTRRIMRDVDEMLGAMLGEIDDMFHEPFYSTAQQLLGTGRGPSYLLHGAPFSTAKHALAQHSRVGGAKNPFGITQDEKQIQFVLDVPGAKADDINLQLDEGGRVLTISGETNKEEGGISVHSRFERSFTLNEDVDTAQISAHMNDGVLTITAPKYVEEEEKKTVRKIDVVEQEKEEKVADAAASHEEQESKEDVQGADETVIDLDKKD